MSTNTSVKPEYDLYIVSMSISWYSQWFWFLERQHCPLPFAFLAFAIALFYRTLCFLNRLTVRFSWKSFSAHHQTSFLYIMVCLIGRMHCSEGCCCLSSIDPVDWSPWLWIKCWMKVNIAFSSAMKLEPTRKATPQFIITHPIHFPTLFYK